MLRSEYEITKKWQNYSKPLVSISCITFNQEEFVEKAIKGLIEQETDFVFEILIHDDASKDNTPSIIAKYQKLYPKIIFPIYQKENQCSKNIKPHAINIERSRGDYIAFCDGDDYWISKNKLNIQLNEMKKYNKCNISFHGIKIYNFKTKKEHLKIANNKTKIFKFNQVIYYANKLYNPVVSMMIKKKVVKNLPEFFFTAPTEDYYLMIIGAKESGALYIPKIMSVYNLFTPNSWSLHSRSPKQYLNNAKSLYEVKKFYNLSIFSIISLKIIQFFINYLVRTYLIKFK